MESAPWFFSLSLFREGVNKIVHHRTRTHSALQGGRLNDASKPGSQSANFARGCDVVTGTARCNQSWGLANAPGGKQAGSSLQTTTRTTVYHNRQARPEQFLVNYKFIILIRWPSPDRCGNDTSINCAHERGSRRKGQGECIIITSGLFFFLFGETVKVSFFKVRKMAHLLHARACVGGWLKPISCWFGALKQYPRCDSSRGPRKMG